MALQRAPGAISLARHRESGGLPKGSGQKAYLVKLGPKIGYLTGGVGVHSTTILLVRLHLILSSEVPTAPNRSHGEGTIREHPSSV
jgi:hypothetical protein|eukprot:7391781-Prymnesium_polylepis.2